MRKIIAIILSLAALLSLAACSQNGPNETTSAPETELTFDYTSYKNLVSICTNKMSKNITILSFVALYEQNYWEALEQVSGTVTSDKLISKGFEYLAENTDFNEDTVTSGHNSIMDFYKEIVSTNISGAEATALADVFNEYFDAYLSLYNLATSPSGDLSKFVEDYESYTSTIENCQIKLDALIS